MIRYVTYARYSSDLQSPDSIDDQKRKCTEYASREGWVEVRSYEDVATSGVGSDRYGFQRLMADAASPTRDFDVLLVDDSSRLSRSLPDVLSLHQRLAHYGIRVISISQGIDTRREESDILIAVHGITDSLYVKELAKKTHRGLEGKFLKGLSAGGRCCGYDIVRDETGSRWVVNEAEASVIRQIFEWSAAGHSLKRIAGILNDQRVAPPQKRKNRSHATWCPTAIREMLRRELYVGRRIWNQTKYVKTPGTNKRVARPRPRNEWVIQEMPELRIISDDLWTRVQHRQDRLKEVYAHSGKKPVNRGASSAYLLSGFLRCGTCNAKLIIVSGGKAGAKYGCPQHWNRKACTNAVTIRHGDIERELLKELQSAVVSPQVVEYLIGKLLSAQHRQNAATRRESRTEELRAEIERIVAAIAAVGHSDALVSNLKAREAELREQTGLAQATTELTAEEIREHVAGAVLDLPALLAKGPHLAKAKLAEHVDSIRLLPQPDGTYLAEGEWDLLGNRGPVMVAGAGFEPATFGL
jgi:DNA invertase Pin-like site-specific DNA recombinase